MLSGKKIREDFGLSTQPDVEQELVLNSAQRSNVAGAAVSIRGVVKDYGDVRAVDGVSLEIKSGEFVALLGPSGSGKTSLLMVLAGFEVPDAGTITVGNRDITDLAPEKRELGMIFQSYALFPHMSVFDNLAFPLNTRGTQKDAIRERVSAALDMVQLRDLSERKPAQLSGGQQQRIAVARALVGKPAVLLADEPLGALDKKLREHMQLELKQLQHELGITVIYVTHDQSEALTMADRIAVMRGGRIVQLGTPVEVYESPNCPFVADFIGETNFLFGTLMEANGELVFEIPGGAHIRIVESAPRSSSVAAGSAAILAIRPERVGLFPQGADLAHPNSTICDGVVERLVYRGDTTLYFVRLDESDGTVVRARVPNGLVKTTWQVGAPVHAVWSQGAAILYGEDDER